VGLLDIKFNTQIIDKERQEIKLYFEYLMKYKGQTEKNIEDILDAQNKLIEEIKDKIYSMKEVYLSDEISANIFKEYMN